MLLHHIQTVISQPSMQRVVFIINTSKTATQVNTTACNYIEDFAQQLPPDTEKSLFFIGCDIAIPLEELKLNKENLFNQYGKRISVISPILSKIAINSMTTVLIIGEGNIFDIDDWDTEEYNKQIIFINNSTSIQQTNRTFIEFSSNQINEILSYIDNPIEQVILSCKDFMPTFWDNSDYHLQTNKQGIELVTNGNFNISVKLNFYTTDRELTVQAIFKRQKRTYTVTGNTVPNYIFTDLKGDGFLSLDEVAIFTSILKGESCPRCYSIHDKSTLFCLSEDQKQIPIFNSFLQENTKGILLLAIDSVDESKIEYYLPVSNVLPLWGDWVAINNSGINADIYKFTETNGVGSWIKQADKKINSCDGVSVDANGRDVYALFL